MQVVGAMLDAVGEQCTHNRRACVPSVSSHCVARELIRPQIENAPLKARLDAVFGTASLDAWASWCM